MHFIHALKRNTWTSEKQRKTTKKYFKAKKKPRACETESKKATLFLESRPRMVTRNGRKKRERGKRQGGRKKLRKGKKQKDIDCF